MSENIIEGGNIVLARKLIESEIWRKPAEYLKIWIYILFKVNYKTTKNFPRGTGFFNFRQEKIPNVTLNQVYEFLRWAKTLNSTELTTQITTQKTTRGIVVKVNNYNKYQNLNNYCFQHRNQHKNQQTTNTITVNKEINKDISNIYNIHTHKEKSVCEDSKNISSEDLKILKAYAKKSGAKNISAYVHKLIENKGYIEILKEEKERQERKKQRQVDNIPPAENLEKDDPKELEKILAKAKETADKIRKGM